MQHTLRTALGNLNYDQGGASLISSHLQGYCIANNVPFYRYLLNTDRTKAADVLEHLVGIFGHPQVLTKSLIVAAGGKFGTPTPPRMLVLHQNFIFGDDIYVHMRGSMPQVRLFFFGRDATEEEQENLKNIAKAIGPEAPTRSTINLLLHSTNGLDVRPHKVDDVVFQPGNYSTPVVEGYEKLVKAVRGKCFGRLTILQGPTGTGKTMFLNALTTTRLPSDAVTKHDDLDVDDEDAPATKAPTYLYVPADTAERLSHPQTLTALLNRFGTPGNKLVLLVEDGDGLLANREASGRKSVVAEFLNICDGMLGTMLNLHVIVTTNLKRADFDTAVIRPGRLNNLLHFEPLSREQAALIIKRETERDFDPRTFEKDTYTLAEVYGVIEGATNHVPTVAPVGKYL